MPAILKLIAAALLLAGCATASAQPDTLDAAARDYVRLVLEVGERDEGFIDAYYGPAELRDAARASPRTLDRLAGDAEALQRRIAAFAPTDPLELRRRDFLLAQLTAARTRLRMLSGERLGFVEEAQGLYGVTPELRPLESYDPVIARIDALVPGEGALADRVEAFQARFVIPADRLDAVMRAAIDECRRRTVRHIALPESQNFTLEFVTGRSWSGYNWYQGDYRSLIQVNTDLPVRLSRAVDLGCHEGYPGHHAYNALLEEKLTRGRGWIEFSVYPLYSPQSFIAEGSANYGIALAFPGDERLRFETSTLFPLAGLSTEGAAEYLALQEALDELSGARFTIARDYLEGRIDRAGAISLLQRYQLVSAARAGQSLDFIDQYRAYVINYGLGRDMVAAHVEAAGADPAARWQAMERLLSEPTLPSALLGGTH
ncbi:hypothetical protein [Sphingosinicella terrae]|uniref:hypothetical protein n=1 Tax=Sphingosinicella terrae TaxID=2172047 RepID=UPI000E0DAA0B|nr:hypothetical protein [Sphingosinicella terrae]